MFCSLFVIFLNHTRVLQLLQRLYGPKIQTLQNEAQFPGTYFHDLISILRPFEAVLLKPFLPETKAVAVPIQNLEYGMAVVAEYKQMAGERIEAQGVLHQNGKSVDLLAHVRASRRKKDTHMGGRENHIRPNTRTTRSSSSESNPFAISMR